MLRYSLVPRTLARSYIAPSLEHLARGKGVRGLFSEKGLQTAWFDRADFYTENLNKYMGQSEEKPLENIVYENAKSASKRDIFNNASMLYNLRFALSCLRANDLPSVTEKPGPQSLLATPSLELKFSNDPRDNGNEKLSAALASSFGSLVEFRSLLLNSNRAISGDGFTWLVARKVQSMHHESVISGTVEFDWLYVLNTYNAGSPFNFNRVGHMSDLKKQLSKLQTVEETPSSNPFQMKSVEEARETESYRDITYVPLLAIDASPKAWITDYGVFGKDLYLERVWESIEWNVVEQRLPTRAPNYQLS
ncbi:mitochondrial 37S ribosomal protein mS43 [Lachancea thermotolerans CBS 6340]|uniref:KLTH0E02684p n=1 Tax=Lachancea thermotolerans (strain ATCC 56472 / CBS 6340 / NRRL Y-8284) TaxID=559295 RepID=C5DHA5_LACTC|nr:mitochondrial 37S ribosomal protein MRP1 [Lachancea thermotolerans CBS 6340]CAR23166.1 KLTH0E02684p [Lachancea thermotolerans CBS 6340]